MKLVQKLKARMTTRDGVLKCRADGIWLTCRFRTEDGAREFAELVRADPQAVVAECRKTRRPTQTGDLAWRVTFTVSIAADQYLTGDIDLRTMKAWEAVR